ncbi:hypothetical protein MGN70_003688 [Eutypa lata]|nr:hypothetical protein MGN70_003688 [Eutypa lata]
MATQQLRRHTRSPVNVLPTRRFTSWMPFEGPNPLLYAKIYEDASRTQKKNTSETRTATTSRKGPQHEDTTAPITTPSNNRNATGSATGTTTSMPTDSRFLCTTLIKIPGCPATWPCDENATAIKSDIPLACIPIITPTA